MSTYEIEHAPIDVGRCTIFNVNMLEEIIQTDTNVYCFIDDNCTIELYKVVKVSILLFLLWNGININGNRLALSWIVLFSSSSSTINSFLFFKLFRDLIIIPTSFIIYFVY